jgi:hypothetical protein
MAMLAFYVALQDTATAGPPWRWSPDTTHRSSRRRSSECRMGDIRRTPFAKKLLSFRGEPNSVLSRDTTALLAVPIVD